MHTKNTSHPTLTKRPAKLKVWACAIDTFSYSEYQLINAKDREFFEQTCIPLLIKGAPIKEEWRPMVFMKKRQRKHSDFTIIGEAGIAMSKKAVDVLLPLIKPSTEILPLKSLPRTPFFFVNILDSLDALDEEKSSFRYSSVTKTKIGVERFAFDPEKIVGKHIFKLKGFWYNTFVSDQFRLLCKKHDLQGLNFSRDKLLWQQR